jgi:hypothetical protein
MKKTIAGLTREELQFALELMDAAATMKMPVDNPSSKPINIIDEENDEIITVTLTDNPFNRAHLALAKQFDFEKQLAVTFRLGALTKLIDRGVCTPWGLRGAGDTITDAIIYATGKAQLKITNDRHKRIRKAGP